MTMLKLCVLCTFTKSLKIYQVFLYLCTYLTIIFFTPSAIAQENDAVFRNFYIYKIALYLKYPGEQQGDFIITVVGDDKPLMDELRKTAASKKVGERTIKIQNTEDPGVLIKSNIIVLPQKQNARLVQVMQAIRGTSVVVISQNAQCQNTCINLTLQGSTNGKKRFEINRTNTESGGVRVSSDLLAIAALCQ